jgi:hypothetical protein
LPQSLSINFEYRAIDKQAKCRGDAEMRLTNSALEHLETTKVNEYFLAKNLRVETSNAFCVIVTQNEITHRRVTVHNYSTT